MSYTLDDWYRRTYEEQAKGVKIGIGESCPKCWKPITEIGNHVSTWTRKPSCACGTEPSTRQARIEAHGLEKYAREFGAVGADTSRPD